MIFANVNFLLKKVNKRFLRKFYQILKNKIKKLILKVEIL